jgi:mono/diheme cytochrome c family protein
LNSWQTAARPTRSYAAAPALASTPGAYAFTKHCAACHTIGGGDRIGPDLGTVTARRDRAWLARFIAEPDVVRGEGDATAVAIAARFRPAIMPALSLSRGDVEQIIRYLEQRATAPATSVVPEVLITSYLMIQRALNTDTLNQVGENARRLTTAASGLGPAGDQMRSAAAVLGRTSSLTAARDAFAQLTRALMRYANEQQASFGAEVKLAYCPMVGEHWLQRGNTIENPFYGKSMSDCGRFVP